MKNKLLGFLTLLIALAGITGCELKYPELGNNAIAFQVGTFNNGESENYETILYNGRTYLPYGELKGTLKTTDINSCIGYVIQKKDEVYDLDNKSVRIYTLNNDKDNNFLMQYNMESKDAYVFYRAADTEGKDIKIPKIINSSSYNYWK